MQRGISGTGAEGADSIVVNRGCEDDNDHGDEFIYTGAGGDDPATKTQIADQKLSQPGNAVLVTMRGSLLVVKWTSFRGSPHLERAPGTGKAHTHHPINGLSRGRFLRDREGNPRAVEHGGSGGFKDPPRAEILEHRNTDTTRRRYPGILNPSMQIR